MALLGGALVDTLNSERIAKELGRNADQLERANDAQDDATKSQMDEILSRLKAQEAKPPRAR
jgi:hypothetical protein